MQSEIVEAATAAILISLAVFSTALLLSHIEYIHWLSQAWTNSWKLEIIPEGAGYETVNAIAR